MKNIHYIHELNKMEVTKMISHYNLNNDIKFLAKSEIRLKILGELQKRPKSIKELVKDTKITYSSVSSNLSKLEEKEYIVKNRNKYHLKPLSEIYYKSLMDFKASIDLINDFNEFWDKHNIDQLSIDSIQNINDLKDSELIETTPIDIYKTHNTIKDRITESENIKAIFPYLHPEYPHLIEDMLKKEGSVELLIPRNMFREIIFKIDNETRKNAAKNGKLKVHTTKHDLKLYLTLCDKSMSLGLFKNDGSFDQNRILISENEKSLFWANNLFETILQQV